MNHIMNPTVDRETRSCTGISAGAGMSAGTLSRRNLMSVMSRLVASSALAGVPFVAIGATSSPGPERKAWEEAVAACRGAVQRHQAALDAHSRTEQLYFEQKAPRPVRESRVEITDQMTLAQVRDAFRPGPVDGDDLAIQAWQKEDGEQYAKLCGETEKSLGQCESALEVAISTLAATRPPALADLYTKVQLLADVGDGLDADGIGAVLSDIRHLAAQ
jgi:hypothetical protein